MSPQLSESQIDALIDTLRAEPGRCWIVRGRAGIGLVYRDGVFAYIHVEEEMHEEFPFDDEGGFRSWLTQLDLSKRARSPWRAVFRLLRIIR